ncbi:hypothetical protein [Sporosarcina sp. HYO08]|nr:hypothetical protein [Sporosarcina sp. HYO08]
MISVKDSIGEFFLIETTFKNGHAQLIRNMPYYWEYSLAVNVEL